MDPGKHLSVGAAPELVLASTSQFRRALLEAAGLPFRAVAPRVDERGLGDLKPKQVAQTLALKKALAVSARYPEALVIGADQTVELAGQLLGKPRSRAQARSQLSAMSNRSLQLHSGIALVRRTPKLRLEAVESSRLLVRKLTELEIESYLDTGEWEGCAGSFRIEQQGVKLMQGVRGEHTAIVGLPMVRLVRMLAEEGFPLFS